jgi:uncharacterized protein
MLADNKGLYKKSLFLQSIKDGDFAVIWHSLFGYPQIISLETLGFLESFFTPKDPYSQFSGAIENKDKQAVDDLIKFYFLIPSNFDERLFLKKIVSERESKIFNSSLVDYLELIMSEACNFGCEYCVHFGNLGLSDRIKNARKFMRFDTAKEALSQYFRILRNNGKHTAEINFGGGEPLLVWPVIKKILEYCSVNYGKEFELNFSINTNASLITPEIATDLKKYGVKIAPSLDGLRKGNDLVRLTKSGKGTFLRIMKGFAALEKVGYPISGISMTITEKNFPYLNESIIDWAVKRGIRDVKIDIDIINMLDISLENIIEKLMRIRRYAIKKDIYIPGFWSRPAENLNNSTIDNYVAFCGGVRGNSICISPSGDIYACGYSATRLGNLSEIGSFFSQGSPYYRLVRGRLTGSMEMCKGCIIEGQCGGGCQITQEFARANGTSKIERMCDFYRRMTQEIIKENMREALKQS